MEIRPIHTEDDYKAALREVSAFFENEPAKGTPEGDRFEILLVLVESYETNQTKLAEQLAKCDSSAPAPADQAAWDNATPVGKEITPTSKIIETESTIALTRRESMRLLELLENPPPFNPKLQSLMERHSLGSRPTRQDLDAEGRQRIRYDADTDILHFELTDQPIVREETCVWEVRVSFGEAGIARISVPSVTAKEMLR